MAARHYSDAVLELRPSRLDHPDSLAMIEQVQQYYVELYGGPDRDPLRPAEFAPPRGGFLIGYERDAAVAMGGWTFGEGDHAAAKVRRMYVAPVARRRGHAAALLAALEADAAAAGATEMILTTGRPQTAAVALYRDAGYTDIAPYGFYADVEGAVHLGKAL